MKKLGFFLTIFLKFCQPRNSAETLPDQQNPQDVKPMLKEYRDCFENFVSRYFIIQSDTDSEGIKDFVDFMFSEEMEEFAKESDLFERSITEDSQRVFCIDSENSEGQVFQECFWDSGQAYYGQISAEGQKVQGVYYWPDQERYIGEFKDGLRSGYGDHLFSNGDYYEGEWKNDLPHGYGVMTFENEDTYEGQWVEGEASGNGVYKFKDEDFLEGEWKNGQFGGRGSLTTSEYEYVGQFNSNNLPEGFGEKTFHETELFQRGQFKEGEANGFIVEEDLKNNVVYTGEFRNGKKHGEGMLTNADSICDQKWHDGELESESCSELE